MNVYSNSNELDIIAYCTPIKTFYKGFSSKFWFVFPLKIKDVVGEQQGPSENVKDVDSVLFKLRT